MFISKEKRDVVYWLVWSQETEVGNQNIRATRRGVTGDVYL